MGTDASLREELTEAFDEDEEQQPEPIKENEPEPAPEPESAPSGEDEPAPEGGDGEPAPEESPEPAPEDPEPAAAAKEDKAPVNWTPAARESWKELPDAVKAQINKREGDINKALTSSAASRKTGDNFNQLANKYATVIAAEGIQDPIRGFEMVLQTMATLRMGSQAQKAAKMVEFIKAYNVDINTLDSALVGKAPNAPAGANAELEQMINQRLAPVQEYLDQVKGNEAAQQQQVLDGAAANVHTFGADAKNEFYNDVRMDMADIMDLATNQGKAITLQEAYDKACMLSPEISVVLSARKSAGSIAGKRKAASSISGKRSGLASHIPAGQSMRDTIAALMDAPDA